MSKILRVENVTKRFGGIIAVKNVSFEVDEKEIVAIVGPNGAGKTTLLNIINGFVKPDEGRIYFRDRDITGLPPYKIAQLGISRTFQTPRPIHRLRTVFNIIVPLVSPRIKRTTGWFGDELVRAIDILEEVGFERDSEYLWKPAGLLPHGYLRRVELARALALRPELILLDELFSGLSSPEVRSIIPLLLKLRDRGLTLIMVEHRVKDVSEIADRVIVLHKGEKIEEGDPETVLKSERVLRVYLGVR